MFEIISGGEEKIGINIGPNYNERKSNYRYFLGILLGPFLEKFGFNPDNKCWDENYLIFQSLLLNYTNQDKFGEYFEKNGYEIIGKKIIHFKIKIQSGKEVLEILGEYGDDIDIKKYLDEVEKGNMFFGFLPGFRKKEVIIVFAKYKTQEITFITDKTRLGIQEILKL